MPIAGGRTWGDPRWTSGASMVVATDAPTAGHFTRGSIGRRDLPLETFRLFNCKRCWGQVRLCTHCDRGNWYCAGCAPLVRRQRIRECGHRYRRTKKGRLKNRQRQRKHKLRARHVSIPVTHHGSPIASLARETPPSRTSTADAPAATPIEEVPTRALPRFAAPLRCSLCQGFLAPHARRGPLRPRPRHYRRGARPRVLHF